MWPFFVSVNMQTRGEIYPLSDVIRSLIMISRRVSSSFAHMKRANKMSLTSLSSIVRHI
jgi:hypothetical protein